MDEVKVALIGAGGFANVAHYPSLAVFDDVELVGVCDLDEQRRTETAEKLGVSRTFDDHRTMLDETKPDAVYAIMPPHVLFDVAMDVLDRGIPLCIEKPPAVTTFQARCMAKLAAAKGVVTAVGFQRRYHPMVHQCWDAVRAKGDVHQTVVSYYKNCPPHTLPPYYRGAIEILRCDAIHAVDAVRYYCGLSPVKSVASEIRTLDGWYDVTYNTIVQFENGCVGVLLINWRVGKRFLQFEFHACGASAFADADGEGKVWMDNEDAPAVSTTIAEAGGCDEFRVVQGFEALDRAFVDAVKTGRPVHNDFEDAVRTMELVDAIQANAINR